MIANVLGPVLVKHNNDIPFMVSSFTVALMLSFKLITHQLRLYFLTAKKKFVRSVQTLCQDC